MVRNSLSVACAQTRVRSCEFQAQRACPKGSVREGEARERARPGHHGPARRPVAPARCSQGAARDAQRECAPEGMGRYPRGLAIRDELDVEKRQRGSHCARRETCSARARERESARSPQGLSSRDGLNVEERQRGAVKREQGSPKARHLTRTARARKRGRAGAQATWTPRTDRHREAPARGYLTRSA